VLVIEDSTTEFNDYIANVIGKGNRLRKFGAKEFEDSESEKEECSWGQREGSCTGLSGGPCLRDDGDTSGTSPPQPVGEPCLYRTP